LNFLAFSSYNFHLLLSWMQLVQFFIFSFFTSFLMSSSHLFFGLPSGRVNFGFPLYSFFLPLSVAAFDLNGQTSLIFGPGSAVVMATGYGLDGTGIESRWRRYFPHCPDRPWGQSSLLYNGYWVFPGGKERPGRETVPSPPSSAVVEME
jgi:hypothetical protein